METKEKKNDNTQNTLQKNKKRPTKTQNALV